MASSKYQGDIFVYLEFQMTILIQNLKFNLNPPLKNYTKVIKSTQ